MNSSSSFIPRVLAAPYSWPFLFKALSFFGFSPQWINLIIQCVCTPKGSFLINRSPCNSFGSSCGLRQGDPMSPYLFILAEKILSLHIQNLMSNNLIFPISNVQGTPSHLFYVDGILLFLQGQKKSVLALKKALDDYQKNSGHAINLLKSKLFIGKCNLRLRRQILNLTKLKENPLSSK